MRAALGQKSREITTERPSTEPPVMAPMSSRSGSFGTTSTRSVTRISTASNQPGNHQAMTPMVPPTRTVPNPASRATVSDALAPRISWLRMSCPSRFVPRRFVPLGDSSDWPASSVARKGASRPPKRSRTT
jgi:hypothetical protein